MITCPECNGSSTTITRSGWIVDCAKCRGRGYLSMERALLDATYIAFAVVLLVVAFGAIVLLLAIAS